MENTLLYTPHSLQCSLQSPPKCASQILPYPPRHHCQHWSGFQLVFSATCVLSTQFKDSQSQVAQATSFLKGFWGLLRTFWLEPSSLLMTDKPLPSSLSSLLSPFTAPHPQLHCEPVISVRPKHSISLPFRIVFVYSAPSAEPGIIPKTD